MNDIILKVKLLSSDAKAPEYAHPGDAGLDLFSTELFELLPGNSSLVKTGIAIELPPNTEAQIRPRSGLALDHQVTVLNSPGTIDSDYRGELKIMLMNFGREEFIVSKGDRVAQIVAAPVVQCRFDIVDELEESNRGAGGFESTGRK